MSVCQEWAKCTFQLIQEVNKNIFASSRLRILCFAHELDDWNKFSMTTVVSSENSFCRSPPRVIFRLFFPSLWTFLEKYTILWGKLKIYLFSADLKRNSAQSAKKGYSQKLFVIDIGWTQNGKSNKEKAETLSRILSKERTNIEKKCQSCVKG